MEIGLVRMIDIDDEMQQSYLDYAMSVIVARALPDARDGMKPVHRRILYAMHSMGIGPETSFKKSARIVGEVLGKHHPHGDMAVYDAMARMAQHFSMRYQLVDGQGNFGSVDGDPPAAMRYTEARMTTLATEMMANLDKDTVDFTENFDGTLEEPSVLPAGFPNLLVNGATGIAVGMSTSIPPHNMTEVCDALIYMLENWGKLDSITIDDLMTYIKGPDFPTGGIILHGDAEGRDLTAAYGSGRGKITLQARVHVEEMDRGRSRIIISELPYQTNKSNLIERIADLVRDDRIEGITDLRDESDRQGMRIVLELTKNVRPDKVISTLYKRTPMRSTFSVIMLALVDDEPRMLSLKQALRFYLEHRQVVVRRRSEYDLARAREREHILTGLRIALKNLDDVIEMIRTAKDAQQAQSRLEKRLKLSEVQARAILDMPLRRLSSLERKKIDQEYKEVHARIKKLEALLGSEKSMRAVIVEELDRIKSVYGDRRRTQIVRTTDIEKEKAVLTAKDLIPAKETWVAVSRSGRIYRTPTARLPRLAGRNAPHAVIGANTQDTLFLFDDKGAGVAIAVHVIPEGDHFEDGTPVSGLTAFDPENKIVTGISFSARNVPSEGEGPYLFFVTRAGMVKKSDVREFPGPSANTFEGVKVDKKDALITVLLTHGDDDVCLVTRQGMVIRFSEQDVRPMGLSAAGVMGVRLEEKDDAVVGGGAVREKAEMIILTEDGQGKRCALSQFSQQGRYGKGVLAWKSGEGVRLAGASVGYSDDRASAHKARGAARSVRYSQAPKRARTSTGKPLFSVKEGNRVTHITPVVHRAEIRPSQTPKRTAPPAKKKSSGKQKKTKGKQRKSGKSSKKK
jgi:DNA gyrase subunit A